MAAAAQLSPHLLCPINQQSSKFKVTCDSYLAASWICLHLSKLCVSS